MAFLVLQLNELDKYELDKYIRHFTGPVFRCFLIFICPVLFIVSHNLICREPNDRPFWMLLGSICCIVFLRSLGVPPVYLKATKTRVKIFCVKQPNMINAKVVKC